MKNSHTFVLIASALELFGALWNLFLAAMFFLSLVWICIGVFWGVVALIVLVEVGVAIFSMAKGYTPFAFAGPILGLVASVCNLNVFGGLFEIIALVLMFVAMQQRQQEDAQVDLRPF